MSRTAYREPKLPKSLLDQVQNVDSSKKGRGNVSRKDRRKEERQQKKSMRSRPYVAPKRRDKKHDLELESEDDVEEDDDPLPSQSLSKRPSKDVAPLKSILKKDKRESLSSSEDEDEDEDEDEAEAEQPVIPRGIKQHLAEDDAEIAALEKKLGVKGKKSKAREEDGLDWLVDGSESDSGAEDQGLKRKRPEDSKWLRDKRLKASRDREVADEEMSDIDSDDAEDDDELENPFSEDEMDSDDFEGFDSEGSAEEDHIESAPQKPQRENPYVPPVSKDAAKTGKYVPPSLRKPASSDEEILKQLRRQVQGLINRLSEANITSIVRSIEEIYDKNARQHVTSTLIDLLIGLASDPSVLNDTFLILHASFSAAIYKVIGIDFGAQLLERVVETFDHHRSVKSIDGKQTLNLIAFLSDLFIFQVVGSTIMFDYIRLLLEEISEPNTELLLRVIRTAGHQLRSDDPSSLKDIVILLQRSVAKVGEANVSVRTKFMIETINNLKNNRQRAGAAAGSALAAEHVSRMKKTLGSINSGKATEPLRITLNDIRDSEKKGKWWLVGASYLDPAKHSSVNSTVKASKMDDDDAGYESETPGSVNLYKLARSQGMNTVVRRAIFVTLLSSSDYKEAHERIVKLHLRNKQMPEIARVLVHCAGAETTYNPFYALVAGQFCSDHKVRKAFEFTLWDFTKEMSGDEIEDEDQETDTNMRKVVNLAKLYGSLMSTGGMNLSALKKLNFAYMDAKTNMFVEVLLTTILSQTRKTHAAGEEYNSAVKEVFVRAGGIPELVQGLQFFLDNTVSKAELAKGKKERAAVLDGSHIAVKALAEAANARPITEESDEDQSE